MKLKTHENGKHVKGSTVHFPLHLFLDQDGEVADWNDYVKAGLAAMKKLGA